MFLYLSCKQPPKSFPASIHLFKVNNGSTKIMYLICSKLAIVNNPANIYLFKVNNRNTRKKCATCSKLSIKTPEQRQWRRSKVFIVSFEHIWHFFLVLLLLPLSKYMLAGTSLVFPGLFPFCEFFCFLLFPKWYHFIQVNTWFNNIEVLLFYCLIKLLHCPHIFFKYERHNHLRYSLMGEVPLKTYSLIKHTCLWPHKPIILWAMNRQAKILLHTNAFYFWLGFPSILPVNILRNLQTVPVLLKAHQAVSFFLFFLFPTLIISILWQ